MAIFFIAVLVAILEITAVPYASIKAATFDLPVIVLTFFIQIQSITASLRLRGGL